MTAPDREMIRWGKLLFERRLISGWGGNLSCRAGKKEFLITGQHAPLGFLTRKDLVRIDQHGKPTNRMQRASSETALHLAVYDGTDAQAVVHAHPPMVLAFSLTHGSFVPVSFEEKYTIGEVPIIAQDTPTVTKPETVVEALKYHPVVIIKGHGTVAIGKNFQEAFLLTDLLEEAVHCRFYTERASGAPQTETLQPQNGKGATPFAAEPYVLFSGEHMAALVEAANGDTQFRNHGSETGLSTSLTLHLEESETSWTVRFASGEIIELDQKTKGEFIISGKREWWKAVFSNRIDPFLATQ
jgi:L-fuculose-phosphate aldolase